MKPAAAQNVSVGASARRGWADYGTWILLALGIVTIGYFVWVIAGGGESAHGGLVADVVTLPFGLGASFLALRTAFRGRGARRAQAAWLLLGLAFLAFWLGDVLWFLAEVTQKATSSPSWADVGYLAYYPLLLVGLLLLAKGTRNQVERLKFGLDAGVIFLGGGLLVWYFVLLPALRSAGSGLGDVITVAYPAVDLLLLLGVATLAVRRHWLSSPRVLLALVVGLSIGFATDLLYGYLSVQGTYQSGGLVDGGYLASWLFLALAAQLEFSASRRHAPAHRADATAGDKTRILPYLSIAVGLTVLLYALRGNFGTAGSAAALVAVLVTILAMVRQLVAQRESSRLREEKAARLGEERFQKALRRTQFSVDHADDSIVWLDPEGRVFDVSESACRRWEYSREELLGMTVFDIDPAFSRAPEGWPAHWRLIKERGSLTFEREQRTKSGRIFPAEITANYMEFGGEEYSCSFSRDISERKRVEEALRATEAQLRQSQKMEAIGQLAGGIAHDFNNLLTSITGYSELILGSSECPAGSFRDDVKEIKVAAERAAVLTRQILAFSRRQALQPEVLSLNEVVTGTQRLLGRTLGEDIDLVTRLSPDLGLAEVDASQMGHVLMNLALNARDAMPGGGKLTVETANVELGEEYRRVHPETAPGSYVMLAVSDTGVGMDEDTKSRVFEPFFTTKGPGKGTGLGLSTVYGTVKQSGGSIYVYSERGMGTTFKIYLPRVDAPSKMRAIAARGSGMTGGQETILVVEDEAGVRELVARILKRLGYVVIDAGDGDEALAHLEECGHAIDLLLTDVVLPGSLQGNELAQAISNLYPRMPVLYMSGYTRDAIVHAGRLDPGVNYIEKPFSPDKLAERVRQVLDAGATPE